MDLRKLRHAVTLAEEHNFMRAADKLHITQSALSQSIARLEAEAGFALFDRDRNGARLTSAGRAFVERATALIRHAHGFDHEIALLRGGGAGSVSFGFGPVPASAFLVPILASLIDERPGLIGNVRVADSLGLLDDLLNERIDFFVAASSSLRDESAIDIEPLAGFPMGYFVRRKHPLAKRPGCTMKELLSYTLLSPQIAESDRTHAKKVLGLDPSDAWPPTIFCDDIAALRQLALETNGVLLGPQAAVREECASGRLIELQPKGVKGGGMAKVAIATLTGRSLSPAAAMVIARLRNLAGKRGVALPG